MDDKTTPEDPIEEIYAVRQRISERYGHDIRRYLAAMRPKHKDDAAKGIQYTRLPTVRVRDPFMYQPDIDPAEVLCVCEATSSN